VPTTANSSPHLQQDAALAVLSHRYGHSGIDRGSYCGQAFRYAATVSCATRGPRAAALAMLAFAASLCAGAVVGTTVISLLLGVPAADAVGSASVPTARAATIVARLIRRAAHKQIRRSGTAVSVTRRCCGIRVLRVHYRAKISGAIKRNAYVLRLETQRGILQDVSISEFSSEAGYRPGDGRWTRDWQDEFALHRESPGPKAGWRFRDFYSEVSQVDERLGGPALGVGFARECGLPASVPRALYDEALARLGRVQ
jgi:hypothetical protein